MNRGELYASFRRGAALLALFALLLALLAACGPGSTGGGGGGGETAPAADPESRVKGFFNDFSQAFNDPEITKPEKQEEWATRLSDYIRPADREQAKNDFKQAFTELAGGLGQLITAAGGDTADVRLQMTVKDLQTKLVTESGNNATVELAAGTLDIGLAGADVEKLGLPAEQLSQSIPVSEFAQEAGAAGDNTIELEKVENVWYLIPEG